MKQQSKNRIDWVITILPLFTIIALSILFFVYPKSSNEVLSKVRFFFGDTFGTYYLIIGLGIFLLSLFIAFSKYGKIVLGSQDEKPKYSFFTWGAMMFTCGLAADILFYSYSEWIIYSSEEYVKGLGSIQDWASVFAYFHNRKTCYRYILVAVTGRNFLN